MSRRHGVAHPPQPSKRLEALQLARRVVSRHHNAHHDTADGLIADWDNRMTLANITDPQAVLSAMQEFDALSREEFLRLYGFGRGRFYELVHQGRSYDP